MQKVFSVLEQMLLAVSSLHPLDAMLVQRSLLEDFRIRKRPRSALCQLVGLIIFGMVSDTNLKRLAKGGEIKPE
jgi:hypothetical protein